MDWLPKDLTKRLWTWGELAQDRTTWWHDQNGKDYKMARQLLYIFRSTPPHKIAELPEDKQAIISQCQRIAIAMFTLFPSEQKEKPSKRKAKSS